MEQYRGTLGTQKWASKNGGKTYRLVPRLLSATADVTFRCQINKDQGTADFAQNKMSDWRGMLSPCCQITNHWGENMASEVPEIMADYAEALENGGGAQELLTIVTGGTTAQRTDLLRAHKVLAEEAGWRTVTCTGGPEALMTLTASLAEPGPVVLLLDEVEPRGLEALRFIATLVQHEIRVDRSISLVLSGEEALITPLLTDGAATFLQRALFIDLNES